MLTFATCFVYVMCEGHVNFILCFVNVVQFSHWVVSDSLRPHGLQHTRLPCPSPTPGACSNSCPLSRWYHPTILSSVTLFSSCLQSFPASGILIHKRCTETSFIPGLNPTLSWFIILLMCCWIQFGGILLRTFASILVMDIGL